MTAAPPSPGPVLLATEGRPIPAEAISAAAAAAGRGGRVHVFSIVRVWGTSLGLPNPGLLPSKREWDEQRENVGAAVKALERLGVAADGRAVATRRATRRIVGEAERLGCASIVMAADPPRNRLLADLMWSQEAYRVRRRARVPVQLVERS
ncbi:MAG TPA: universal stress protein [Gaiellaceae bacterium]|nr:universal stress protein [Gaiellaceae bacterium]